MTDRQPIDLRFVGGLACLTLLYPVLAVLVNVLGGSPSGFAPVSSWLWLAIGVAWILIVWLAQVARPLATLVLAGLVGGVLTLLVVGVIQLTASGTAGVLDSPSGMLGLVALNTLGGTVCGLLAWALQSATGKPRR